MKMFRKLIPAVFTAAALIVTAGVTDANAAEAGVKTAKQVRADSPSETVKKFADAMSSLNFEEAKKYCDKDSQKVVDSAAAMLKAMPADTPKEVMDDMKNTLKESFTFTVKGEKITGDKAVVTIVSKNNGKTEESTLPLKKVSGKWILCD